MTRAQQERDPRTIPIYSTGEVASMLAVPTSTITSWAFGMRHGARIERQFQPVIRAADREGRRLSFVNLIELHVLVALLRHHKLELPAVRKAVRYLGGDHPLASEEFRTDGVNVFVERLGELISASQEGQVAMREILEAGLQRVEREQHRAVRLFPFTRPASDLGELKESPRLVAIDPRHRFGAPFLVGSGVDTETIWSRYQAGDSVSLLESEFGASREAVEEAIRYHGRPRRMAA